MKPETPEQLARLLDQLSASYPNGIPLAAIQAPADSERVNDATTLARPYHIFIAGEEETLSSSAKDLLTGITTKGLKISHDECTITFSSQAEIAERAAASDATHVLVFGSERESGWGERADGRAILFTHALEHLVSDAALKKELWRHLQAILT